MKVDGDGDEDEDEEKEKDHLPSSIELMKKALSERVTE